MNPSETGRGADLLRPAVARVLPEAWVVALLLFLALTGMRFAAVYGPPWARPLFLAQALAMWVLPWLILSREGRRAMGLRRPSRLLAGVAGSALAGMLAGGAILALCLPSAKAEGSLVGAVRQSMQLDRMLATMPLGAVLAAAILPVVLFTPIGEEFFFRGILHEAVARRWKVGTATAANGLCFGLVHLHVNALTLDAAGVHLRAVAAAGIVLSLMAASALFTWCRVRTGSIWGAVAAHACCNLAFMAGLVLWAAG